MSWTLGVIYLKQNLSIIETYFTHDLKAATETSRVEKWSNDNDDNKFITKSVRQKPWKMMVIFVISGKLNFFASMCVRKYIQLGPIKTAPLLNKYYWNEGTLTG